MVSRVGRRYPVGAEVLPEGGVHFRVWAPQRQAVTVVLEGRAGDAGRTPVLLPLAAEGNGYFSGHARQAANGSRYRFRLDDDDYLYPDPVSRYQPEGPHGVSQVSDASRFEWSDRAWPGVQRDGQVLYEMHFGTFTQAGTYQAAAEQLPELARIGITVLEVMPVAEFDGRFGWGYDGVDLFAPSHLYGTPDDFRYFVDQAHAAGLGVILDVVYNHFGPSGSYHAQFAGDYFTSRYKNEWGAALNFDGENAAPVREFFITNARYWIEEFHLDGLRLDATQQIFDASPQHILADLTEAVRDAGGRRATYLVAENEPQHARLVRPIDQGGYGMDALWNDDFHHSATVALTGHNEAYYTDYLGKPQEFVSAAKWGYLYQGQWYRWQQKRRGAPAFDLPPAAFINFIQNHDQIANSGRGERIQKLTNPGRYRAMTALMLLLPGTPMLFQGQEFAASSPFLYFADQQGELASLVRQGRREFVSQFASIATPEAQAGLADPDDPQTFLRCKLDFSERERHAGLYAMHQDLLRLRREDPLFRAQRPHGLDGAILSEEAFVLRYFSPADAEDRLLIVNLGRDLPLDPVPEPLLAPPEGRAWQVAWSSEHPRYGGNGTPPLESNGAWRIPGETAMVLAPGHRSEEKTADD
jgi:maltooligosyltrehalose trehalohydrolase